jgi:hypothetical protein
MDLIHIPNDIQIRLENHVMAGHERIMWGGKYNWLGRKNNGKWTFGIYQIYAPLNDDLESACEGVLYSICRDSLMGLYPAIGEMFRRFVLRRDPYENWLSR